MVKTDSIRRKRNGKLFDTWSFVHFVVSAGIALLVGPLWAIAITVAWEPVEILIISPLVARLGIVFGHESLRNSLSDIFFNTLGILVAVAATSWL